MEYRLRLRDNYRDKDMPRYDLNIATFDTIRYIVPSLLITNRKSHMSFPLVLLLLLLLQNLYSAKIQASSSQRRPWMTLNGVIALIAA